MIKQYLHFSLKQRIGSSSTPKRELNVLFFFRFLSTHTPSLHIQNTYQLSHLSSSLAPGPIGVCGFLILAVPTAPLRGCCGCALGCAPASAKLSQKSFLLSSIGTLLLPSFPSTNRLKPSAAPFAPAWAPLAT